MPAGVGAVRKCSKSGGKVAEKIAENATKRGREAERRVLQDIGETKNTQKVTGREGNSVPDFINKTQIGEIKDTQRVADTKQIRTQREAAQNSNREHVVITGENTKISKNVANNSSIERRNDLGPQK